MKNLTIFLKKNIPLIILNLFIFSSISFAQDNVDYSQVKQHDGLIMQRVDDDDPNQIVSSKAIMNFHSHTDAGFDYVYLRATESDALQNNMILTDGGLLVVGDRDDCSIMTVPTEYEDSNAADGTSDFTNLKLYVNGQIATSSGVATNYIVSDERMKKNIKTLTKGLDIIRQANFVEYEYKDMSGVKRGQKFYGVLAQEMKEILPSTVVKVQKRLKPTDRDKTDMLMFNPNDLFYSGLNAIKELDQENQDLKERVIKLEKDVAKNKDLEQRVNDLEQLLEQFVNGTTSPQSIPVSDESNTNKALLKQNIPNPLYQSTSIGYYLPKNTINAYILIQDLNGRAITQYNLQNIGAGKITFDAKQYGLSKGTYVYSLIINEQIVDTKKMIFLE